MKWKQLTIWDILVWVALGFITLWLILKMSGIINTPVWLLYAPLFSAVYVAGWAVSLLLRLVQDLQKVENNLKQEIKDVQNDFRTLERERKQDIHSIELDIGILKNRA